MKSEKSLSLKIIIVRLLSRVNFDMGINYSQCLVKPSLDRCLILCIYT